MDDLLEISRSFLAASSGTPGADALPHAEAIHALLGIAIESSRKTDESRPVRGCLRVLTSGVASVAAERQVLDGRSLSKLLTCAEASCLDVAVSLEGQTWKSCGLVHPSPGHYSPQIPSDLIAIASVVPAGLRLHVLGPDKITLSSGVLTWHIDHLTVKGKLSFLEAPFISEAMRAIWKADQNIHNTVVLTELKRIVSRVRGMKHGGLLLIGPDRKSVARSLTNATHLKANSAGAKLDVQRHQTWQTRAVIDSLDSANSAASPDPGIAGLWFVSHFGLERHAELVAGLAQADGGVVLSHSLDVLAFGAMVKSVPDHKMDRVPEVKARLSEGTLCVEPVVEPSSVNQHGARHKAAYAYCSQTPAGIAIVVSEDGDVRCFAREPDAITCWECFDPDASFGSHGETDTQGHRPRLIARFGDAVRAFLKELVGR